MITIELNGEAKQINQPQHLAELLQQLDDLPESFAIAVNAGFVPKTAYETTPVNHGDQLELLVPMQGG